MDRSNIAANVVHTYDGDFTSLELRALAMASNPNVRQPRKPGLYEQQISAQRNRRAIAMHRQVADVQAAYGTRKDFTKVPIGYMHPEIREALREHADWGHSRIAALFQGVRLTYTEQGDFTHLTGRGI